MTESYQPESILDVFHTFHTANKFDRFTIANVLDALGERSFGFVLLLMALPNAFLIASIPGLSSVFGTIMALTSIQMVFRFRMIWLPKTIRNKIYTKDQLEKVLKTSRLFLGYIEPFLKPRILTLTAAFFEPLLGLIIFINSAWIALPIPFGNFLPGVAMVILSLGIISRDGVFIIAGSVISFLIWVTLGFIYHSAFFRIMHWFGF